MCQTEAGASAASARAWAGRGGRRLLCSRPGAAEGKLEGQEERVRFEEGGPAWASYPQPIPFPTQPTPSSIPPLWRGCPHSMLQSLHVPLRDLGWEDEGNQIARGWLFCAFCLLGSGLPVLDPPCPGCKRKSKGLHPWDELFRVPEPVPFSPGLSRASDQTLPTFVYALSLLWTRYKDDKRSLTPLSSLHEKKKHLE